MFLMMMTVVIVLTPFLIISWFVYILLASNRKKIIKEVKPNWFAHLPAAAQQVHLKEIQNKTAEKFTGAWVAEYWHGKRSAFYAVITWGMVFPLIYAVCAPFIVGMIENAYENKETILIYAYLPLIYLYFAFTIIFRCTINSPKSWKYIIRTVLVFCVIFLFILIILLIIKTLSLYQLI